MSVYVRELARALAARGTYTDIFTRAAGPAERVTMVDRGVRVVPVEAGPRGPVPKESLPSYVHEFAQGVRLFSLAQRVRYDVVHSHYWQSGLAAADVATAWNVPLVHSHHTLGRVKNATLAPGDAPEPESRLRGEQRIIAAADVLIASTDTEYLQLSCMYGASHDRLKVVPPGVDHQLFRPMDKDAPRAALGLQSQAVMLFVGRVQPLKGIDLAIQATEQLMHALDREPLLLIVGGASGSGGEDELRRLRDLATSLGVEQNVRFIGPKPHQSLPQIYAAADVVVVPSHSESFGLAALEAHACGRPVVATAVGGLSHIVDNGRSGFLTEDRDPATFAARLKTLLADEQLARSMGERARMSAARFSWDQAAATFSDLYTCLVDEHFPEACTC